MKISIRRKTLRAIKFIADLVYLPSSGNLIGIDLLPRFRIIPRKMIELLSATTKVESLKFGYQKGDKGGQFYFKNVEMSEGEALVEFHHLKNSSPYGFMNETDYVEYASTIFDESYQKNLEERFFSLLFGGLNISKSKNEEGEEEQKIEITEEIIIPLIFVKQKEYPSKTGLYPIEKYE